jgi:WD40 repeat protein
MSRSTAAAWLVLCLFLSAVEFPAEPARSVNDKSPPRVDALGDPLPDGAVARFGTMRFKQSFMTYRAVFSPDGKTVACVSAGGGACIWEVATGKKLRAFEPGSHLYGIAFSPDGSLLAAPNPRAAIFAGGGANWQIQLYDAKTGNVLSKLDGHEGGSVMVVAFSPDGKTLASGGHDKLVRLWDVATGQELRQFKGHEKVVRSLSFSPEGNSLASAGTENTARVWDVATGNVRHVLTGHEKAVGSVSFSRDGKLLATASEDETVRLWDAKTGKEVQRFKSAHGGVLEVAFSPISDTLASGDVQGWIVLWDTANRREVRSWKGVPLRVNSLAWSPDGGRLVTTGVWTTGPVCWDTNTGKPLHETVGHSSPVDAVQLTDDGRTLRSIARDHTFLSWSFPGGQITDRQQRDIAAYHSVGLSRDGRFMATAKSVGGPVQLLDAATGTEIRSLPQPPRSGGQELMFVRPAFSDDGKSLATADSERLVNVWDVATGTKRRQIDIGGRALSLALTPDGSLLLACFKRFNRVTSVGVWDVAAGKERPRYFQIAHDVDTIVISPCGKFLGTGEYMGPARLWDMASGKELCTFHTEDRGNYTVAFSPDSRFLIGSSEFNGLIHVWDTATGQEVARFDGHVAPAFTACFTADCRRLITGGSDSTILVWDLANPKTPGQRYAERLTPAELDKLWDELPTAKGCEAIWRLADAAVSSVPYLKERVPPVARLDAERERQIAAWLTALDDTQFSAREKANKELEKQGAAIKPLLTRRLGEKLSPETRRRVEALLDRLQGWPLSGEELRRSRAVQALEYADAKRSRPVLEALANGAPDAALTREAKEALHRVQQRR